jgi:hypothetical protein
MTIIQNHHRTTNRGTVALMLFVNGDEKHKRCIRTVPLEYEDKLIDNNYSLFNLIDYFIGVDIACLSGSMKSA